MNSGTVLVLGALFACLTSVPLRSEIPRGKDAPPQVADEPAVLTRANIAALRRAITDLTKSFGPKYPSGPQYLDRLDIFEKQFIDRSHPSDHRAKQTEAFQALLRDALLDNPLLDFEQLLLIRRRADQLGLPANWQGNCSLPRTGFDNEIATVALASVRSPRAIGSSSELRTVYRPAASHFVGDLKLHFEADRLLFSSIGSHNRWQVFELQLDSAVPDGQRSPGLRQVTPGDQPDVDNYDACYLPDGRMIFCSTAGLVGVPCVDGSDHVATLYLLERDGRTVRQLCFDQDHNWSPTLLNDGRVLYQRWEYADTPHAHTRLLFRMNPDGTTQEEFYGSNSYWPNSIFYARPIPGHPTKVVAIVSGHHGVPRMGELVIFDPAQGRQEAAGVVQRIPGFGQTVEPWVKDALVDESWPKFLHPFPLSEKYFLVSAKPTPQSNWGIYLVDIFDNMLALVELPGHALFEPTPLRKHQPPPAIPDRVDLRRKDALVYLADIYKGEGLKGVPRGTVKRLRIFAYHWAYHNMGGLLGTIGLDGPWDVRRILGTVPVNADGSAYFRVPANTPISVQPLDDEGKAIQLMRSWFTAMPGENLSCVGCHERQNSAPLSTTLSAFKNRQPSEIEAWHGPARGFSFKREVQPVLDRHCVRCHDGQPAEDGSISMDLRGTQSLKDFLLTTPGHAGRHGGKFSVGYANLHRYVRRPGIESDYHLLTPLEYHADTTELVQLLKKSHYDVQLDPESWDRLVTWIDLNAPYHGNWSEEIAQPGGQVMRRRELRKLYAGMEDEDAEVIPVSKPVEFKSEGRLRSEVISKRVGTLTSETDEFTRPEMQNSKPAGESRRIDLGGVALELVPIPAGEFLMGDPNGNPDEQPTARVRIAKPFWMARTEISNEQFAMFDPAHDSHIESKNAYQFGVHGYPVNEPLQPVVRVSWDRAVAFCAWLSQRTGQNFTLPTEAQWEFACRAGTQTPFYFGPASSDFSKSANLADAKLIEFASDPYTVCVPLKNPTRYEDFIPKDNRFNDGALITTAVGSYEPNAWGLLDMHGNASEWTRSSDRPYPYADLDGRNELSRAEKRVVRGGSWRDRPHRATSTYRLAYQPWQSVFNVGFRIICEERDGPTQSRTVGIK